MTRSARHLLRAVVSTLLLGGALATTAISPSPAAAACASPTQTLAGTVEGADGRYVSSQVGIELFTASGVKIGMDGCPIGGGYSANAFTNLRSQCCFLLPGEGSVADTYDGRQLTKSWSLTNIPSNAATAWIEVYPKRSGGQPNTSLERYGYSMRRPLTIGRTDVHVKLPLQCRHGGDTGSFLVSTYDHGSLVAPSRVGVWSLDPDSDTVPLGWGLGNGVTGPRSLVEHLAPGNYWLVVTVDGQEHRKSATVRPCEQTRVEIAHAGPLPVGNDTPGVIRDGVWHLRNANSSGPADLTVEGYASDQGISVAGDWDGDGIDTIGIVVENRFYLRNSNTSGPADIEVSYGRAGDTPVVGDWNGDGTDTVGVRRNNVFHLRNTNATGVADITLGYGRHTDTPVVGDWDGDGTDTFGVRRNNVFYLRNRNTTGVADITLGYGRQTDTPIVGDWDGDGIDTFGIRRGTSYYLRNSNTTGVADITYAYGASTDTPIAGDWDGV